jgi:hypothetical protein
VRNGGDVLKADFKARFGKRPERQAEHFGLSRFELNDCRVHSLASSLLLELFRHKRYWTIGGHILGKVHRNHSAIAYFYVPMQGKTLYRLNFLPRFFQKQRGSLDRL